MAWELLDTHASAHGSLELYTLGRKEFMIRFDGIELMNSLLHSSEDVLGELAVACCTSPTAPILIGGLGLGFTLAASVAAVRQQGLSLQISVAELTPTILGWFERYFRPMLNLPSNCASLLLGDAHHIIGTRADWAVICLDIDNGPSYLATDENQKMYTPQGLQNIYAHLREDGVCLVWSANEEPALIKHAQSEGFAVCLRRIQTPMAARVFEQYIYVLSKTALTNEFCQRYHLHLQSV